MRPVARLLLLALCSAPLHAQLLQNPAQWYINNQIYSTRVFNSTVGTNMPHAGSGAASRAGARPAAPTPPVSATSFSASATSPLPAVMAAKSSTTSQGRAQAQQMFESYLTLYRQTAAKDGFPANDLAYAFEYYVVNNYQIYHDLVELPLDKDPRVRRARDGFGRIEALAEKRRLQVAPSEERAIYNQFRQQLSANPTILRMSDAEKQEAAETMAIAFGVNFGSYLSGVNTGNDALAAQARQLAKEGLERLLGRPIESIRITPAGLAP